MSASEENNQGDEKRSVHLFGVPPAFVLAVLAVTLTFVSVLGNRAQVHALIDQGKGSDVLAKYHTSIFQQRLDRSVALAMRGIARGEAQQGGLLKDAAILEQRVQSPHAKRQQELLVQGNELEHARDKQLHKYHTFQFSEVALDLAIVVTSLAVIIESVALETTAVVMGLAGFVLAAFALVSVSGLSV